MKNKILIILLFLIVIGLICFLVFDDGIKYNFNKYFGKGDNEISKEEELELGQTNTTDLTTTKPLKQVSANPEDVIPKFINRVYVAGYDVDHPLATFNNNLKDYKDIEAYQNYFSFVINSYILENAIDAEKINYEFLNDYMVKCFGPQADGILPKNKDFGELLYDAEEKTYSILPRGLQENPTVNYFIDSIKDNEDGTYTVELYDYLCNVINSNGMEDIPLDVGKYKIKYQTIHKKDLYSFDMEIVEAEEDGFPVTKGIVYDKNHNEIETERLDKIQEGIDAVKMQKNKLYKRTLVINYDSENDICYLVSSDMVK